MPSAWDAGVSSTLPSSSSTCLLDEDSCREVGCMHMACNGQVACCPKSPASAVPVLRPSSGLLQGCSSDVCNFYHQVALCSIHVLGTLCRLHRARYGTAVLQTACQLSHCCWIFVGMFLYHVPCTCMYAGIGAANQIWCFDGTTVVTCAGLHFCGTVKRSETVG